MLLVVNTRYGGRLLSLLVDLRYTKSGFIIGMKHSKFCWLPRHAGAPMGVLPILWILESTVPRHILLIVFSLWSILHVLVHKYVGTRWRASINSAGRNVTIMSVRMAWCRGSMFSNSKDTANTRSNSSFGMPVCRSEIAQTLGRV